MAVKLQLRRDTTANWSASNPVLAEGEIGIDTTLKQAKIGDGVTAWNSLVYGLATIETVGVTDGDKGDVVVASFGTVWTVDSNVVTNAKLADMATATIKGRVTAGTGDPEDLTVEQARTVLSVREALTANRTYFVRNDGSNSNTGLTNSAGGAFATLQKAYDTILTIDLAGYTASIVYGVAGQTITNALNCTAPPVGGNVTLDLGGSTLNPTATQAIAVRAPFTLTVTNGTIRTTTSGNGIYVQRPGRVDVGASVTFGATAGAHIGCDGGSVIITANYTISGSAYAHYYASAAGFIESVGFTHTLTGTPGWTSAFADVSSISNVSLAGNTWSGAATGSRYASIQNSLVNTYGAGASHLPGSVAGSTATGGLYA
jgi:hypothetical protein